MPELRTAPWAVTLLDLRTIDGALPVTVPGARSVAAPELHWSEAEPTRYWKGRQGNRWAVTVWSEQARVTASGRHAEFHWYAAITGPDRVTTAVAATVAAPVGQGWRGAGPAKRTMLNRKGGTDAWAGFERLHRALLDPHGWLGVDTGTTLGPDHAERLHVWAGHDFTGPEAAALISMGLDDPKPVTHWRNHGCTDEFTARWRPSGWEPAQAIAWAQIGATPQDATGWAGDGDLARALHLAGWQPHHRDAFRRRFLALLRTSPGVANTDMGALKDVAQAAHRIGLSADAAIDALCAPGGLGRAMDLMAFAADQGATEAFARALLADPTMTAEVATPLVEFAVRQGGTTSDGVALAAAGVTLSAARDLAATGSLDFATLHVLASLRG